MTVSFAAKPGCVYYVYPPFPGSNTWMPKIEEFADANALRSFHPGFTSALEDGERLLDRVTDPFGAAKAHSLTLQANQQWE